MAHAQFPVCRWYRTLVWSVALISILATRLAVASEPLSYLGFDADGYSPEAQAGLQEILEGNVFHVAIPEAAARMLMSTQIGAQKESGLKPNSPEAHFYVAGRLPSPPDRGAGFGQGFGLGESVFDQDGRKMVNFNCFTCHAGVVNGQVVAGLGNNHINQSDPRSPRTRGDNFGPYEVWRMGARLADPAGKGMVVAKEQTQLQALIDSLELPPVDPMPWWLMKYKEWNYWYSDGGSHNAANFSVNFTVPHAEMNAHRAEHIQTVAKALAFARETQSPLYPATLDAERVRLGADLFHGRTAPADKTGFVTCKNCHGTYTRKAGRDDLSQPGSWSVDYHFSEDLRNVKTDPTYNNILQQLEPIAENINKLEEYFKAQGTPELIPHARVPDRPGYIAPPLVGVWASAPYFHNGSVPTIDTVLNSAERPEIWARNARDPHAYDLARPGMLYQPLTRAEFDERAAAATGKPLNSPAAVELSASYDTKGYGHGNMGHTFGDHLTAEERSAVIEFLKSLSGPDM